MQKDLADVCKYLKSLIIQTPIPDGFIIAERFRNGLTDNEIKLVE